MIQTKFLCPIQVTLEPGRAAPRRSNWSSTLSNE